MVKPLTNPFVGQPLPLGSLLAAAAQRLSTELDMSLHRAGLTDLRAAHAPVFMAIDPDGTRLSTVAERAQMTKQAVGEHIGYLKARGYLSVAPDLHDRRAKVVNLTAAGWTAVRTGRDVVVGFDDWFATQVGPAAVAQLRATLDQIIRADRRPSACAEPTGRGPEEGP